MLSVWQSSRGPTLPHHPLTEGGGVSDYTDKTRLIVANLEGEHNEGNDT